MNYYWRERKRKKQKASSMENEKRKRERKTVISKSPGLISSGHFRKQSDRKTVEISERVAFRQSDSSNSTFDSHTPVLVFVFVGCLFYNPFLSQSLNCTIGTSSLRWLLLLELVVPKETHTHTLSTPVPARQTDVAEERRGRPVLKESTTTTTTRQIYIHWL